MSRVGMGGKIPMKDAYIMSSLPPPEEDPLLAGLQGVDTVIEHFIKNAQGESCMSSTAHKLIAGISWCSFRCFQHIFIDKWIYFSEF